MSDNLTEMKKLLSSLLDKNGIIVAWDNVPFTHQEKADEYYALPAFVALIQNLMEEAGFKESNIAVRNIEDDDALLSLKTIVSSNEANAWIATMHFMREVVSNLKDNYPDHCTSVKGSTRVDMKAVLQEESTKARPYLDLTPN